MLIGVVGLSWVGAQMNLTQWSDQPFDSNQQPVIVTDNDTLRVVTDQCEYHNSPAFHLQWKFRDVWYQVTSTATTQTYNIGDNHQVYFKVHETYPNPKPSQTHILTPSVTATWQLVSNETLADSVASCLVGHPTFHWWAYFCQGQGQRQSSSPTRSMALHMPQGVNNLSQQRDQFPSNTPLWLPLSKSIGATLSVDVQVAYAHRELEAQRNRCSWWSMPRVAAQPSITWAVDMINTFHLLEVNQTWAMLCMMLLPRLDQLPSTTTTPLLQRICRQHLQCVHTDPTIKEKGCQLQFQQSVQSTLQGACEWSTTATGEWLILTWIQSTLTQRDDHCLNSQNNAPFVSSQQHPPWPLPQLLTSGPWDEYQRLVFI
jgi:hypothetical protein